MAASANMGQEEAGEVGIGLEGEGKACHCRGGKLMRVFSLA